MFSRHRPRVVHEVDRRLGVSAVGRRQGRRRGGRGDISTTCRVVVVAAAVEVGISCCGTAVVWQVQDRLARGGDVKVGREDGRVQLDLLKLKEAKPLHKFYLI